MIIVMEWGDRYRLSDELENFVRDQELSYDEAQTFLAMCLMFTDEPEKLYEFYPGEISYKDLHEDIKMIISHMEKIDEI